MCGSQPLHLWTARMKEDAETVKGNRGAWMFIERSKSCTT